MTEPEADEFELYDLTLDPTEVRNLAHPSNADDRSRALQRHMLGLLHEQLEAKRLTPAAGAVPGYRPPPATVRGTACPRRLSPIVRASTVRRDVVVCSS